MASAAPVLLLLLLLLLLQVSLVSASHYFGASATFSYKGTNPDGSFRVDVRKRATFDGCNQQALHCYNGNCGSIVQTQRGTIDRSANAPRFNRQWCETEELSTWKIWTDKPFRTRAASCCWILTRNQVVSWKWNMLVDVGRRSDTGVPNQSPDIAILPFLRVPQNCLRTYKLMSFDPDGDRVRCRYGNVPNMECSTCSQPEGFHLDQDSCVLHYRRSSADTRVYGFEMVVEDFPRNHVTLSYTDGSTAHRSPLGARRNRQAVTSLYATPAAPTTTQQSTPAWRWWTTARATATVRPPRTTTQAAGTPWWWWMLTQSPAITTTPSMTTPPTAPTRAPTTSRRWWWWTSARSITTTTQPLATAPGWMSHQPLTTPTRSHTTSRIPPTLWRWWTSARSITTTTQSPATAPGWMSHQPLTTPTRSHTTSRIPPTPWGWWTVTQSTTTRQAPVTHWWWWWMSTHSTATTRRSATTKRLGSTSRTPTTSWWWMWNTPFPSAASNPWWYTKTTTPKTTPTTGASPFSRLPLQFSLLVDPPAPSCQEGLYLPKFVYPTPENGARIKAEVDELLEIRVRAQAAFASIHDIIISGPMNITKRRASSEEFVLELQPTQDELGEHYPVCFAVESVTRSSATRSPTTTNNSTHQHATASPSSGVFQSEMRCVLLDVVKKQIRSHVTCGESSMRVEVERSFFPGVSEDRLRLSDAANTACSLRSSSNSSHVVAIVPLNACGTQIQEDEDYLVFRNVITSLDGSDVITRTHLLQVAFSCRYPRRGNVTLSFSTHRRNLTVWDRAMGTFTYRFEFFSDDSFAAMLEPTSYPLVYELGARIYMQIEATATANSTQLFVDTCRAAPYDNPDYATAYSIIQDGCPVDPTVQIYSSNNPRRFQFSMEAFKFIGLFDQVYISCSVLLCEAGNPNTRCSKGCMNTTDADRHHRRRRNAAAIQSENHFVSQGPLRLRTSSEDGGRPENLNLNLNLVFIAGCLLAALVIVSGLTVYKSRQSTFRYQPLPTAGT